MIGDSVGLRNTSHLKQYGAAHCNEDDLEACFGVIVPQNGRFVYTPPIFVVNVRPCYLHLWSSTCR